MGGYHSGGHNRTHDYTDRYKRIDSFEYGKYVVLMGKAKRDHFKSSIKWADGSSIGVILYPDRLTVSYTTGGDKQTVQEDLHFTAVSNTYGGTDRLYFECPYCGRRSRLLYMHRQRFKTLYLFQTEKDSDAGSYP